MQSWQRDCALEGSGVLIREVAFVSTHFLLSYLGCAERQVTPAGLCMHPPGVEAGDWETDASRLLCLFSRYCVFFVEPICAPIAVRIGVGQIINIKPS